MTCLNHKKGGMVSRAAFKKAPLALCSYYVTGFKINAAIRVI